MLNPGQTFDTSFYSMGTRQIIFRVVRSTGNKDVALHSLVSVGILQNGQLQIGTILSDESENSATSGYEYGGIGRSIVSNIISGENIPTYTPTAPSLYNATAAGAYNADITGLADTWAFNQNAGRAEQLGGFQVRLDGLTAFINPCDSTIATPTPC